MAKNATAAMDAPSQNQMDDYDVRNHASLLEKSHKAKNPQVDVRTLAAANKIKADKSRHSAAKKHAAKEAAGLKSVATDDAAAEANASPDGDDNIAGFPKQGKMPASGKYQD